MLCHDAVHECASASCKDRIMRQYGVRLPLVKSVSFEEAMAPGSVRPGACPFEEGRGAVRSALPVSKLVQATSYPGTHARISANAASGVRRRIGWPIPWRAS